MSATALAAGLRARWAHTVRRRRANDPGSLRLHRALSLVLAAAASALVCWLIARATGQIELVVPRPDATTLVVVNHPIAVMTGAMPAMVFASIPLPAASASRLLAMLLTGPMFIVGLLLGAGVGSSKPLASAVLCLLATAIVLSRRVPRVMPYGMPVFFGTFLAVFMKAHGPQLPWLALMAATGTAVSIAIHLLMFWPRPMRTLRGMRAAFHDQGAIVLAAAVDELSRSGPRTRQRLVDAVRGLGETGLVLDAQLAAGDTGLDASAIDRIHQLAFDQEAAYYGVVRAILALDAATADAAVRGAAVEALGALRAGDPPRARGGVAGLLQSTDAALRSANELERADRLAEYHLAVGLHDLVEAVDAGDRVSLASFRPTVRAAAGALLGSGPATVATIRSGAPISRWRVFPPDIWQPAARMLIATSAAVVVGNLVSDVRWYWAFFGAFSVLSAANTAAEHLRSAIERAIGTAVGVVLAIGLAHVMGDLPVVSFALMFATIGVAFYVRRGSVAVNAAAMTLMVAQLYNQLHTYTDRVLVLRVEETAIGVAIAIVVSLTVFRVRTVHVAATATSLYLDALARLIDNTTSHLHGGRPSAELRSDVRSLQDICHQLFATVVGPTAIGRDRRTPLEISLMGAIGADAARVAQRSDLVERLDGDLAADVAAVGADLTGKVAAVRAIADGRDASVPAPSAALDRRLRGAQQPAEIASLTVVRELAVLDEHLIELAEAFGATGSAERTGREIVRPRPRLSYSAG